jgi:predicted flap endonuclease-1-like 5' DNA nuclease
MSNKFRFWFILSMIGVVTVLMIKRLLDQIAILEATDDIILPPQAPTSTEIKTSQPPASKSIDDLTQIRGIGPKIAGVLHAAGIKTFQQLANTEVPVLRDILKGAGIRLTNMETWAQQANNMKN